MPLMKHSKTGRLIAVSSNRVDALMAEGFEIERPEPEGEAKKTAPKKISTKKS